MRLVNTFIIITLIFGIGFIVLFVLWHRDFQDPIEKHKAPMDPLPEDDGVKKTSTFYLNTRIKKEGVDKQ